MAQDSPEDWGDSATSGPEDWGDQATPTAKPSQGFDWQAFNSASNQMAKQYAASQLERLKSSVDWKTGNIQDAMALPAAVGGFLGVIPHGIIDGITDLLVKSHKAWNEGLTPQEETEFATNAMLAQIGAEEEFRLPKAKKTISVAQEFHEDVAKPIVKSVIEDAAAKPSPWKINDFRTISGDRVAEVKSPDGKSFRFDLERTGDNDVGITQVVQGLGGRSGVGPQAYQALADHLAANGERLQIGINEGQVVAGRPGLSPAAARVHEKLAEAGAITTEEGRKYVTPTSLQNLAVAATNLQNFVNDVQEARELGIVGGPHEDVPTDTPAMAAQRAIPANMKQGDKITMTPAGEPISEFEQRFNDKMERIERPEDFKQVWKESAAENNYFPEARQGNINPAHKEALAEAAGVDPTTIKDSHLRDTFSRPDEVRMAAQSLDKLTRDFQETSQKYEADPSPTNKAAMMKAAILKDYALEQTTGYDAEWGHTGHALLQEMKPSRQRAAVGSELTEGLRIPKPVKDLTDAIDKFKDNATQQVTAMGKDKEAPLGLDSLIKAAADLVDEFNQPKKARKPSVLQMWPGAKTPEVTELVKTAQAVVNLMNIERPKLPDGVRPLRAILSEKSEQGKNALASFNKLVSEAEANVKGQIYRGKTPSKALTPELADLVQRAGNVTNYFGGAGLEKAVQDAMNSKGWTDEDLLNIARAVNRTDIKGTARLMASMRGQNNSLLYSMWTQGLISGPFTHTKYALANATYALTERGVTTPIAAVIGKVLGRADADRVLGNEAMGGIWGLIRGVPDAFKAIKDTPWGQRYQTQTEKILLDRLASTGEEIPKDLLRSGQPFGKSPIAGIWGRIMGTPGYVAGDIHTFFKVLGDTAGTNAEAFRQSSLEGNKISDPNFWDRLDYHKANLSTEALMQIREDSLKGTFMQRLPESLEALAGKIKGGKYLRWIFPFTHIPVNLMRATLEHTPLAIVDPKFRADLMGKNGGRMQDKAIARVLSGSAIMGYFVNEYMQGRSTGNYPTDPKERAEWQMTNKIPNAIQIGDRWHSFDKFGPAGALASLGANIGHIISHSDKDDPENWTKMIWMATEAAADSAADFPGFQTLQNFFRAKEDPKSAKQFMAWQAGSLLPFSSLISQSASFLDPSMRRAKTFVDGLMYRLPGIRESLIPKLDPVFGEPIVNPGYASVIRNVPVEKSPIKQELERIGLFPHAPKDEIGKVKLTPDQYYRYQATAGPLVKKSLTEMMDSPVYQMHNGQPEWQATVAEARISEARRKAAAIIQADSITRDGDNNLIAQARAARLKQINGRITVPLDPRNVRGP